MITKTKNIKNTQKQKNVQKTIITLSYRFVGLSTSNTKKMGFFVCASKINSLLSNYQTKGKKIMAKSPEELLKELDAEAKERAADAAAIRRYIEIQKRLSKNTPSTPAVRKYKKSAKKSAHKLPKVKRGRPSASGVNLKEEIFEIVLNSPDELTSAEIKRQLSEKLPKVPVGTVDTRVRDVLAKDLKKDPRFYSEKAAEGKGKVYGRVELKK